MFDAPRCASCWSLNLHKGLPPSKKNLGCPQPRVQTLSALSLSLARVFKRSRESCVLFILRMLSLPWNLLLLLTLFTLIKSCRWTVLVQSTIMPSRAFCRCARRGSRARASTARYPNGSWSTRASGSVVLSALACCLCTDRCLLSSDSYKLLRTLPESRRMTTPLTPSATL